MNAGDGYHALLPDFYDSGDTPDEDDADELQAFRVRVQESAGPRTRLLTLSAASEEEARALATADLDDSWAIVDVSPARSSDRRINRG